MLERVRIYRALLRLPGNKHLMLLLADSLEDCGQVSLATAYRWAAERGHWPLRRKDFRKAKSVYDWESKHRALDVPAESKLDRELWTSIRLLPDKKYGGPNSAFVLLARGLTHVQGQ